MSEVAREPLQSRRVEREDVRSDVTVIGAGFAGLTAAALLARDGLRVSVLERDIHPGGCAASYTRKTPFGEFRFPVGATVAAGLEEGGVMRRIFGGLGLEPRFTPLDPVMRLHLPDRSVSLPGTRSAWDAELARAFPGGLENKRAFWREIQGIADVMHHVARRYPVMPFRSVADVLDTAKGVHPGLVKVLVNLKTTVLDLLEKHRVADGAHKAFVDAQLLDSMQCVSDACAAPNGAYALEVYRFGAQYVPGGLASLAEQLASSLEANGSRVHYATRARRVIVENGRAVGVEAHGRNFLSPVVISTAPLPDTARLLGEAAPRALTDRAQGLEEIWGAFTLYIGLRERVLPENAGYFEQVVDFDAKGLTDNFLVSVSPSWDRSRAPEGHRSVTISTHVRAQEWFGLCEDDYRAKKRALEARILARLEALWPDFLDGIVHLESGSPRTFERFTLHGMGRVGGVPQTVESANFNAQHHTTGVQGLYLAGETVFPGQGTLGVSVSGFNAYRTARRFLGRIAIGHQTTTPAISRVEAARQAEERRVA